jgi:cytoskeletal protein CcmA (bactofilin family)
MPRFFSAVQSAARAPKSRAGSWRRRAVQGAFNGTIHANSVKLQGTAAVNGEIFNKSLVIEPNVQFEGVSRRLDRTVEAPAADQAAAPAPETAG